MRDRVASDFANGLSGDSTFLRDKLSTEASLAGHGSIEHSCSVWGSVQPDWTVKRFLLQLEKG